jgi:hypothetical protein
MFKLGIQRKGAVCGNVVGCLGEAVQRSGCIGARNE